MIALGIIIALVGLIGSAWASNYRPGLEESLEYLVDGKSSGEMEMARFFNAYGWVILVIGIALIVYGFYKKKEAERHNRCVDAYGRNEGYIYNYENSLGTTDAWRCSICGKINRGSGQFCTECGTKRNRT